MTKLDFSIFRSIIEDRVNDTNLYWRDHNDKLRYELSCKVEDAEHIEIFPKYNHCAHAFGEFICMAEGCGYSWYVKTCMNDEEICTPCLIIF